MYFYTWSDPAVYLHACNLLGHVFAFTCALLHICVKFTDNVKFTYVCKRAHVNCTLDSDGNFNLAFIVNQGCLIPKMFILTSKFQKWLLRIFPNVLKVKVKGQCNENGWCTLKEEILVIIRMHSH